MAITILLADDHKIMREGLASMLAEEEDLVIVGQAETGREAVHLAVKLEPDVVVMDVGMPDLNGIEATRQIRERVPRTRVLALSMHADRRYVVALLRAGGTGYLLKGQGVAELVRAIREVAAGFAFFSPRVAAKVVDVVAGRQAQDETFDLLTPREREVLQLIAEGCTTREIGKRLHLSPKTIESHRTQLMTKLDLHSIADLTRYAIREGVSPLD